MRLSDKIRFVKKAMQFFFMCFMGFLPMFTLGFAQNQEQQVILLLGDTNIQRDKPESAFSHLMPNFENADFIFLNLEGAFAAGWKEDGGPDIPHKIWTHSSADQVKALTEAGISAVGVANNVTYPWQAFVKSKEVLENEGIPFTGGGMNLEEALRPVILERAGLKVGFIQYAATVYPSNHAAGKDQPGILGIKVHTAYQAPPNLDKPGQPPLVLTWVDPEEKKALIRNLDTIKGQVDVLIASCHWGVSDTYEKLSYQREIAEAMVEGGADLVFGHGPHRLQEVEWIDGKPVFYSLGQAVFDDPWIGRAQKYREGIMLRVFVQQRQIHALSIIPLWREDDNELRAYSLDSERGDWIYQYLKRVSKDSTLFEIQNQEILLKPKL